MRVLLVLALAVLVAMWAVLIVGAATDTTDEPVQVVTIQPHADDLPRLQTPTVPRTTTTTTTVRYRAQHITPRARTAPNVSTGRCGGTLPPCWVMRRESGGNIHAYNPAGCGGRGCRGKWQCDPRTCTGQGTEEQQDAEARALWNNGRGCSHWSAC